jgi:hypothetical protein
MDVPHKIHVKLGDFELITEGSEEAVNARFAKFQEMVANLKSEIKPAGTPTRTATPTAQGDKGNGNPSLVAVAGIDPEVLKRVFGDEQGPGVSLHILPRGDDRDSKSLILLLYGFSLKGQKTVPARELLQAAKQSGVTITRIDKTFRAEDRDLYTKAGAKSGSRYGLTNQGTAAAEGTLKTILG